MSGYNNSLRYYKTYYEGIQWGKPKEDEGNKKQFEKTNKELCESKFPDQNALSFGYDLPDNHCITLSTVYPGLLLGSGISHGSNREGEFKLGFFFDHTSGLPVIPGSSVKGVLRSVFPLGLIHAAKKAKAEDVSRLNKKAELVTDYLKSLLKEITKEDWLAEDIGQFETWLFGNYESGQGSGAISGRVIFHDAIPISTDMVRLNGESTNRYLAPDFLTPHKEALKNPIPIQFLKVLPGVVFKFQFVLYPYNVEEKELLSAEQIRTLFEAILLQFGVGAKTNVGYGQFMSPDEYGRRFGTSTNTASRSESRSKGEGGVNKPSHSSEDKGQSRNTVKPLRHKPPTEALDISKLGNDEYYATVLPGKEDRKKQFGDVPRLQIIRKGKEEFLPFRAKDGNLTQYPIGTILKVKITPHLTNRQEILAFEVIDIIQQS